MRLYLLLLSSLLVATSSCVAQPRRAAQPAELWGFAAPWDVRSDASIRNHGAHLSAVVTGWIGLDSATGRPLLPSPYADTIRPQRARAMAIVTSWHGEGFHTASIRRLATNAGTLASTAGAIARHAAAMRYAGLVFDFETLERSDLAAQLRVMRAMVDSARARGVTMFAAAIPATDTMGYPARPILEIVDFVIPMFYDEHWLTSGPGPIASPAWVRRSLALRIAEAGADRIVAGLPTYGYLWQTGKPTEHMGFEEAQGMVARQRLRLERDRETATLRARAPGWELWVADAELIRTLVSEARRAGVQRFALWRLGREDPALWALFDQPR